MVVRVDISYLTSDLRYIIVNNAKVKSIPNYVHGNGNNNNNNIITFIDENSIQKIKQIIQHIFTENHINGYIIAENIEEENEIAILKQGDMEQFGIYICTHCGMSFESEIQRTVHQRIHYFT
jgi:flagellar biosynthesis/type III secretory pathway chaperone